MIIKNIKKGKRIQEKMTKLRPNRSIFRSQEKLISKVGVGWGRGWGMIEMRSRYPCKYPEVGSEPKTRYMSTWWFKENRP